MCNFSILKTTYMSRSFLLIFAFAGTLLFSNSCKKDKQNDFTFFAPVLVNHAYGNEASQVMDVYLPNNRNVDSTKVIILIPRQDWLSGTKEDLKTMVNQFRSKKPQYAYFTINYRLYDPSSNENKFPTQEEDIAAAIEYIKANRLQFKVSDKVAIVGEDAGAHLALLQAYKHNSDHFIKAVAAISPLSNLQDSLTDFPATKNMIQQLLGGTVGDLPLAYKNGSPIEFIQSAIPTAIFHKKLNPQFPYQQSVALHDSLNLHSIPSSFKLYEGEPAHIQPHIRAQIIEDISIFFKSYNP